MVQGSQKNPGRTGLRGMSFGWVRVCFNHQSENGSPHVRGVLGIHVDDGIGGGDDYFMGVIES